MNNKIMKNKWTFTLTIVYGLLLVWIIIFKLSFSISELDEIRKINVIPFYYDQEASFHLSEVIKNLLVFIPIGVYFKMMKFDGKRAIILGFVFSLTLEVMQFVLKVGASDITDLITNTVGVAIGVLIYNILLKIFVKAKKVDKVLNILATIGTMLICLFLLALIVSN